MACRGLRRGPLLCLLCGSLAGRFGRCSLLRFGCPLPGGGFRGSPLLRLLRRPLPGLLLRGRPLPCRHFCGGPLLRDTLLRLLSRPLVRCRFRGCASLRLFRRTLARLLLRRGALAGCSFGRGLLLHFRHHVRRGCRLRSGVALRFMNRFLPCGFVGRALFCLLYDRPLIRCGIGGLRRVRSGLHRAGRAGRRRAGAR